MNHALVVGGTGMLADVSVFLINKGYHVLVIGRDRSKYERNISSSNSTFLSVDYHDNQQLRNEISDAINQHGNLQIIVAWIHSSAPNALPIILEEAAKANAIFRLFHVLGSSSNLEEIKEQASLPEICLYRQVQLGYIVEDNRSRWLRNHEIARGVIEAICEDLSLKVIGTLLPWENRPH